MAKPNQIHVILIRAGRTEWDSAGRVVGNADVPPCGETRAGLRDGLDELDGMKLTIVLAGTGEASQCVAEVAARLTDAKVRTLDDLSEIDLGLWQGLLTTQVVERYPRVWKQWRQDATSVTAPEGESLSDAEDRIISCLARALDKIKSDGEPVVGVVLRPIAFGVARCWLRNRPLPELWNELDSCGDIERHTVSRETVRQARERVRAAL